MNFRYFSHLILQVPLIPLIYFQGKKVYKKIPKLPDAEGTYGESGEESNKKINLIFIGESAFARVGVQDHINSFVGYFSKILSEKLNAKVYRNVYAKSGYNIQKVNERILPKIEETDVDLILIGTGGNDSFELTSPKKFVANMQQTISVLQNKFPSKPVLFVNFPPVKYFPIFTRPMQFVLGTRTEILQNAFLKSISGQKDVYFMSDSGIFQKWSREQNVKIDHFFSDGVHPSESTYHLWAKEAVEFCILKKILKG